MTRQITWEEFETVDLRVGTIVEVRDFPDARKPAYQIFADFWALGIKKSSAQITKRYSKEELIGKQILGVVNFPVKQIGNFFSEFLVTGFVQPDWSVILAVPDKFVENGAKLA